VCLPSTSDAQNNTRRYHNKTIKDPHTNGFVVLIRRVKPPFPAIGDYYAIGRGARTKSNYSGGYCRTRNPISLTLVWLPAWFPRYYFMFSFWSSCLKILQVINSACWKCKKKPLHKFDPVGLTFFKVCVSRARDFRWSFKINYSGFLLLGRCMGSLIGATSRGWTRVSYSRNSSSICRRFRSSSTAKWEPQIHGECYTSRFN
jgi:hypothetical protein